MGTIMREERSKVRRGRLETYSLLAVGEQHFKGPVGASAVSITACTDRWRAKQLVKCDHKDTGF